MVDKLEAGKTYVFIDDEAKDAWVSANKQLYDRFYNNGFTFDELYQGEGWITNNCIVTTEELKFFKLKEEQPMQQQTSSPIFNSAEDMVGWYVDLSDKVSTKVFCECCNKLGIASSYDYVCVNNYARDVGYAGYPYMCVLKDSNIIHLDAFYSDYPNKYTMNEFKASQEVHTEVLSQKMNNLLLIIKMS